jgi:hypothetical protein
MITQEFLTLLLETLAATIPAGAHPGDAGREASLAMACTMLEALHPADAKEAAAAARAIAAHFAAMDGFARAARPGIADDTAVRLRNNALAAARLADAVTRQRRQAPLPEVEKQSRVRHRAELPATIPGLPDVATTQPMRRAGLHSETALSPVQPTVSVPG